MLRERLTTILEPVLADLGYELVLLEFNPHEGAAMLRLFIDSAGGITLEDCQRVSREVSGVLDVEDVIPHAYRLEVSSPGLDRPLVTPEHFRRFQGELAKIQMLVAVNGRKRFQGVIAGADARNVELEMPEGKISLALADVERARLVPNFERGTTT